MELKVVEIRLGGSFVRGRQCLSCLIRISVSQSSAIYWAY